VRKEAISLWVCVCVCRYGPYSETVPTQVTPSRRGVTSSSQTPPLVEEKPHFKRCKSLGENNKYENGSQTNPKRRITVLSRVSSNLTDRPNLAEDSQSRQKSRDSAVGIATGYGLDDQGVGVRVPLGSRTFSSPRLPDRLRGPPSLLSNGYRG
jgi:hypothetical protein